MPRAERGISDRDMCLDKKWGLLAAPIFLSRGISPWTGFKRRSAVTAAAGGSGQPTGPSHGKGGAVYGDRAAGAHTVGGHQGAATTAAVPGTAPAAAAGTDTVPATARTAAAAAAGAAAVTAASAPTIAMIPTHNLNPPYSVCGSLPTVPSYAPGRPKETEYPELRRAHRIEHQKKRECSYVSQLSLSRLSAGVP